MINLSIKEPVFRTDKEALDWYRDHLVILAEALERCDKEIKTIVRSYGL